MLKGKTIILGVSGGIAAYKAAALCSKLAQAGANVHVIMTESAEKFIAPLTFQTLSRNRVAIDTFNEHDASVVQHIDLADSADLFVVAPATANVIGKLAAGIADDMLSTTYLATTAPVLIAPAMNVHMYDHPAVQHNIEVLTKRGVMFYEPGEGQLACGYVGKGRLAEPELLLAKIESLLADEQKPKPLAGKRVLITAGGTIERIDPVRYITNDSSGKMGFAIAEAARDLGADVTVVHARVSESPPAGVRIVKAESAIEMFDAVMAAYDQTDLVIKAAAVADYRIAEISDQKIKKSSDTMTLNLVKNPDILQTLGERKTRQFTVGFAAETGDLARYATDKLMRKKCDLLVANDVTEPGAGFAVDTNRISIFDSSGLVEQLPLLSKRGAADRLLEIVIARMAKQSGTGQ
jgi:phosphopantothenoylcysteine decarboxylase / phosphopantothenate---cysteine ligase